ncbi:MAG: O-antigen ligase family protein [Ruminococcus sp.]
MNKKNKKTGTKTAKYYTRLKYIGISFSAIMLAVFPLYLSDRYFNARHDKLNLFYFLAGVLVVATAVVYIFFDDRKKEDKIDKEFFLKTFSVVDWAMIAFAVTAVISTYTSDYFSSALTGSMGRNNGLLLILVYTVTYFIMSRIYKQNIIVLVGVCISSALVSLLGIANQFYWDPLNLYKGLSSPQVHKFISTIGNRNMFSAYLCIMIPIVFMVFIYTEKRWMKWLSATSLAFCLGGMICSNSDSSILGFGAFIIFAIILFVRDLEKMSRLFFGLFLFTVSCKLIRIFSLIMEDYSMGFGSIQKFFIYGNTYAMIALFAVISTVLYFVHRKHQSYYLPKCARIIAIVAFSLAFVGVLVLIIYYSVYNTKAPLKGAMSYLRFNDSWGTHRGFMWIRALYIFGDMSIMQKIFGSGPDTFTAMMDISGYNEELIAFRKETTDCAHNVYLNYLVTLGIAGVASYITAIVSSVVRAVKKAFSNKYAIIFASSVVCYGAQSIVNIDQPITTPLFILMLALTESQCRVVKQK